MKPEIVLALQKIDVDTEGALRRFSGNSGLYGRFLKKFLTDDNYSKIIPAITSGDYESAQFAAHTLKGVSANLGLNPLYNVCSDLVNKMRARDYTDLETCCKKLEKIYGEICEVLAGEILDSAPGLS